MSEAVLLTGATGFLGTRIARQLIENTNADVIVLVRAASEESSLHRLRRFWWQHPDLLKEIGCRICVEYGDLGKRNLGRTKAELEGIADRITRVVHCAADLRLDGPIYEMRSVNVDGTAVLLDMARRAKGRQGFSHFLYVSTAYVAGRKNGHISEDVIPDHPGFANNYEMTKCEAERIVLSASQELQVTVVRPGMVVGDSKSGSITTFNTVYYPLRLYMTGDLRVLPIRSDQKLNIVPVDYVAEGIRVLIFETQASGTIFHLTAPYDSLPRADEFMKTARMWAANHLKVVLPRLLYFPIPAPFLKRIAGLMKAIHPRSAKFWRNIELLIPYMNDSKRFSRMNTDAVFGSYVLEWQEFVPRLFSFAAYHGFLNRLPRTVHEQLFARLSSKSRPVSFSDIGAEQTIPKTSTEMRQDTVKACAALKKIGIRKGDRVVIIGSNSSRYLILDTAIGLLGAVSVPLYITTPADDIDRILTDVSCRMLCVGSREIFDRIHTRKLPIPVVSFEDASWNTSSEELVSWETFLGSGEGASRIPENQISYDDIATIRYSSGTTGVPRGIAFTHGQLVWMAEAVSALPPWRTRIQPIHYLSFLPMNHVVEGILALYSPYYAPAPLTIAFIEDLHTVSAALPIIRPTVFFSVPRLYEKLWWYFMNSFGGKVYRNLNPGFRNYGLRTCIRRGLLRRAGLDRCDMLIVGSAVMDNGLLESYHELGIEIHNAYGLTEAPLITINRYGSNRIGTVGTPLPDTEIRCDDSGQILVRGPQIAHSSGNMTNIGSTSEWFSTGDTGIIEEDGYLVLTGRLQDVMITSYGKNVHPHRVEMLMNQIPGIMFALLVGDGKPFCTAILWIEKSTLDMSYFAGIERAMTVLKQQVPKPEQPKRWAILSNDLSIDNGALTPNLKLRKRVVLERNTDIIDALYDASPMPERVMYIGGIDEDI